jgi:hypothetical protein
LEGFKEESSRFLKKAAQKLLRCWVMGVVADTAHGPANQSFFASFCSQKEGLLFRLSYPSPTRAIASA